MLLILKIIGVFVLAVMEKALLDNWDDYESRGALIKWVENNNVIRVIIVTLAMLALTCAPQYRSIMEIARQNRQPKAWLWFLLNTVLFVMVYFLSWRMADIGLSPLGGQAYQSVFQALRWALMGCLVLTFPLMMAPGKFWLTFFVNYHRNLLVSGLAGFLGYWVSNALANSFWQVLANWTFRLVVAMLGLFYSNIVCDPQISLISLGHFSVEISFRCSGYEGIILIMLFVGSYLAVFRSKLLFPNAFLLFPLGVASIWLLNALRIALLVVVGYKISPEIAAGGFHSFGGWVMFIVLSIALIFLSRQLSFFAKPEALSRVSQRVALCNGVSVEALLLPYIALSGAIMLTGLGSAGFDWGYPLKVLAALGVLLYFRRDYAKCRVRFSLYPVLIGGLVFGLWILMSPVSEQQNQQFAEHFFGQAWYVQTGWLVFRVIGATVTVPMVEELAFRGYLLRRLADIPLRRLPGENGVFTWLSFLLSSLIFGMLHGDWLAGSVAGAGFAVALYRRNALQDSIVAHMTTNLLLSGYVLATGNWSLW